MPSENQLAKEKFVGELNQTLENVMAAIVAKPTGINAEQIVQLRKSLREKEVTYRVIKNTLAKRAIQGTQLEVMEDAFTGPTALACSSADPVAMAKVLTDFAKAHEGKLSILAGMLDGQRLSPSDVESLANVPSREVLLSRLVGSLQSPYAGFVYCLSGMLRKLVYALDAVRREKEEKGA